jgi:hypothetical protein
MIITAGRLRLLPKEALPRPEYHCLRTTAAGADDSGLDFFGSFFIKKKGIRNIARQGVKNVKNF